MDVNTTSVALAMLIAAGAGFVSFISPCVLPLVPAYLCFVSGMSAAELRGEGELRTSRGRVVAASLAFVLGFSVVFVALGASATAIGGFLLDRLSLFSKIAGVLVIVLGLQMIGLFRLRILQREKRIHVTRRPRSVLGAFVVGLAFAFGWTPCVGPILAGILALAASQETIGRGIALLAAYSLGLGIPFIAAGLAINRFVGLLGRVSRYLRFAELASGVLLVAVGVLIFTNGLTMISQHFGFLSRFAK
jgi:cytochrome c-type biogenesis protein